MNSIQRHSRTTTNLFINDIKKRELGILKKKLKRAAPEERRTLKLLIQRLENQTREEERRKKKELLLKEERAEIQKAREEGKQPFYLKKSISPNLNLSNKPLKLIFLFQRSAKSRSLCNSLPN